MPSNIMFQQFRSHLPLVRLTYKLLRYEQDDMKFHPTFPSPVWLDHCAAYEVVARGLNMLRVFNPEYPPRIQVTIERESGTDHGLLMWSLNYPAEEWFCDLVRAVGYKETP